MSNFHAFENQTGKTDAISSAENPQLNLLSAIGDGEWVTDARKWISEEFRKLAKPDAMRDESASGKDLKSLLEGNKLLPQIEFENMKGLLEGDAGGFLAGKEKAKRAADIIADDSDLGSDTQKKEIAMMFEEAYKKGPEAVAKLVKDINAELEKRGSDVRVGVEQDFDPKPSWGEKKYGNVVVRKDGVVEDRVAVYENNPMKRNLL